MYRKIRVALIFKKSSIVYSGNYFTTAHYHFYNDALSRNPDIEVVYFKTDDVFDTTKLKGKFDVILLPQNHNSAVPNLDGIKQVNIPVICGLSDPHHNFSREEFHERNKVTCYFSWVPSKLFYKYYPSTYIYKIVYFGLEPSLYTQVKPFDERIKNRILNSGAVGNTKLIGRIYLSLRNKENALKHYKLRTICNKLSYIDYTPTLQHEYVGDKYTLLLQKYRASIAAATNSPVIKYFEIPASGCLTFMEVTEKNEAASLGFLDFKTCVFINEKNYKDRFEEFLTDPDNLKWRQIADKGREFALANFNNDKGVQKLVEIMKEFI